MSPQCIGYIIGIIALTVLSAFFSASETAYNSLNKIKLKNKANEGSKGAKKALLLVDNYDKLITTILIGNNIVNIAAATIATLLFTEFIKSADLAATVSTIVVTVITLIFGEITPKSIAKEFSESFASKVATILQILCLIFTPFTYIFSLWQKLMIKIFKPSANSGMSEAELITMVDEATTEGGIDKDKGELIRSAIEFNELTVKDIFTPRVDVIAVDVEAKKDELRDLFLENGFSRLPVFEEDIDNVIGILHEKDFYKNYFKKEFDIRKYMTKTIWVTLNSNLSSVLKMLQKSKAHMAVVLDEYGGTAGIVTLEDILEELVGEIWDEHDEVVEDITQISENEYQITGGCNIEDMFDKLEQKYDSDDLEVTTVSGWIVDHFGYIPSSGEQFDFNNLTIKVLDADPKKIEKIYVKVLNKQEEEEENTFIDKFFMKDNDEKEDDVKKSEKLFHKDDKPVDNIEKPNIKSEKNSENENKILFDDIEISNFDKNQ